MATTTNFGWETPDDTDLVKDGAAAIRTALGGVDTSFVDLKGGTTGQVLAKASGTDLDFSWVAVDPLTILDAKGDLITATAADTPARLAVGTNGQTLVADSTASTGLKWATPSSGGGTTLISTTTMSGASVTLSSIPQTYTYLLLVFNEFTNNTADGFFRIDSNGDGGIARISGVISSGTFSSTTNILQTPATYDRTNADNGGQIQIYNYTAANNYNKAFVWSGNYYAGAVGLLAGGIMSANNGAITSIVLSNTGGTWAGGTTYLYGVK